MNKGTIIRVVAMVITLLAALLCMFDIIAVPFWGEAIIAIALVVSCAACTYYNNDFTEEACLGTGLARQLKAQKAKDYIGEDFSIGRDGEDDELN